MKLVVQRVKKAKVSVGSKVVGQIDCGLFVLIGIGQDDSSQTVNELATKLIKLRIMSDDNDKLNLSIKDAKSQILAVSQFTLYADTTAGNRPSFVKAMEPVKAKQLYELFVSELKKEGIDVQTGQFGEYMNIECVLDGPVTILLEN